jgi:hypothetical protein
MKSQSVHRHHRQPAREKRGVSIDPRGYDVGKKIKGKKRHVLVDTLRHPLILGLTQLWNKRISRSFWDSERIGKAAIELRPRRGCPLRDGPITAVERSGLGRGLDC